MEYVLNRLSSQIIDHIQEATASEVQLLAGANELAVRVDVFNTTNHALLVSFTAKGKSALHPLSSENDMDAAIREAVDEIIKELES